MQSVMCTALEHAYLHPARRAHRLGQRRATMRYRRRGTDETPVSRARHPHRSYLIGLAWPRVASRGKFDCP